MLTIYWSSIVIGLIGGLVTGIAIALWATWKVDNEIRLKDGSDFSKGFDRGWECGMEHQQMIDKAKDK